MINSQPPNDNIDARLDVLGNELDQLITEMGQVKRKTICSTGITFRIQDSVRELLDIARLHQEALRLSQFNAEQDREVFRQVISELRDIGAENQRLLEHLFR